MSSYTTTQCPICEKEVKAETFYEASAITSEMHALCSDIYHHWSMHFHYGSTQETIGHATFNWNYSEDATDQKEREFLMKVVTHYAKELYRKRIGGK